MNRSEADHPRRQATRPRRAGLTLLEMIVVVFILGALAVSAVTLTDGADQQLRYEDTVRRLDCIQQAIVGDPSLRIGNQAVVSGYVSDLGCLPQDLSALLSRPTDPQNWYNGRPPIFDPKPDASGFNDGPISGDDRQQELSAAECRLFKGWRGPYLQLPAGSTVYRDGWGNRSPAALEATHQGWKLVTTLHSGTDVISTFTATSLGSDGFEDAAVAPQDAYQKELSREIDWMHWQVKGDLQVEIENRGTSAVSGLRASLLIYHYSNRWKRLTSGGDVLTLGAGEHRTVTIPLTTDDLVPMGEHLLVLVQDADSVAHNEDDKVYDRDGSTTDIDVVATHVVLLPRTLLPRPTLIIP